MKNILLVVFSLSLLTAQASSKKPRKIKLPTGKKQQLEFVEFSPGKFMGTTEISNYHWNLFLRQSSLFLKADSINKLRPDSNLWRRPGVFNEPYVRYYYNHPAYTDYPISAISPAQAMAFCNWLNRYYQTIPELAGLKLRFRLPTLSEWRLAYTAKPDSLKAPFPWGYSMFRKPEKVQINYCELGQENFRYPILHNANQYYEKKGTLNPSPFFDTTETQLNRAVVYAPASNCRIDGSFYQTQTDNKSYTQTESGLIHMSGNVSEWLSDGRTIGGNCLSPGYYLRADAQDEFEEKGQASALIGFRVLLEVID